MKEKELIKEVINNLGQPYNWFDEERVRRVNPLIRELNHYLIKGKLDEKEEFMKKPYLIFMSEEFKDGNGDLGPYSVLMSNLLTMLYELDKPVIKQEQIIEELLNLTDYLTKNIGEPLDWFNKELADKLNPKIHELNILLTRVGLSTNADESLKQLAKPLCYWSDSFKDKDRTMLCTSLSVKLLYINEAVKRIKKPKKTDEQYSFYS